MYPAENCHAAHVSHPRGTCGRFGVAVNSQSSQSRASTGGTFAAHAEGQQCTYFDAAVAVVEDTVKGLASEPDWAQRVLEPPGAAGVESLETGVVMVALTVRCAANADVAVEQEIRRRVTTAFRHLGIELGVPPVAGASEAP